MGHFYLKIVLLNHLFDVRGAKFFFSQSVLNKFSVKEYAGYFYVMLLYWPYPLRHDQILENFVFTRFSNNCQYIYKYL